MELIADGVLILAALAAMAYCMVLSRRLRRLTELDGGLGAAITALSREVDHLNGALAEAKTATTDSATDLGAQCRAAHVAARRLETLVKSANKTVLSRATLPSENGMVPREDSKERRTNVVDTPPISAKPTEPLTVPKSEAGEDAKPETEGGAKVATRKAGRKSSKKPEAAIDTAEVRPEPTKAPASENATPATFDATALDQFIGAIIAKGDADDNAALARRLVMALATQQSADPS